MNKHKPYKYLTPFAKKLRARMTDAERLLWKHLRNRQFMGIKFRRQQQIGPYIVDFVSLEKKLVIEIDGGQHLDCPEDADRDSFIKNLGFIVLRFWNNEVLQNTAGVLEAIKQAIE